MINFKFHLVAIIVFFNFGNVISQANFVNIGSNSVCSERDTCKYMYMDILHLPAPCLAFDDPDDLNLDLVFEEYFDAPTIDLTK
jgi:hypothetical protein